jgi:hypothetical protein
MNEWGMQKVMTVTVDNASSNDGGLNYLRKQMVNAKICIENYEELANFEKGKMIMYIYFTY